MNLLECLMVMGKTHQHINGTKHYSDLFRVSLDTLDISNNDIYLMKGGEVIEQDISFTDGMVIHLDNDLGFVKSERDFFEEFEEIFKMYYHSVPTVGVEYVRSDFLSKAYDKLTFRDFSSGVSYNEARYYLEWFILSNIINKNIKWKNEKHFFWRSQKYPVVIYKRWIKE